MRLYLQYGIVFLISFFVIRLFFQASNQENTVELPKSILLARLSDGEPIPARFQKEKILKAILSESERLIDRKPSAKSR